MRNGPIVIAHDGSSSADHAVEEAAHLFPKRDALVVTVWEPGTVFDAIGTPWPELAPLEINTALKLGKKVFEEVQSLAERFAERARAVGLDARGLAVVDDLTVAETIIKVAEERNAPAVVLGAHGHKIVREVLVGSTTLEVMQRALCPVVVVRDPNGPPERHSNGGSK